MGHHIIQRQVRFLALLNIKSYPKLGCKVNFQINAFMYADDLLIVASCVAHLQKMIAINSEALLTLDMRINTKKSTCIKIGPRFTITPSPIILCDRPLFWSTKMKYLGHTIMVGKKVSCDHHPAKYSLQALKLGLLNRH